MTTPPRRASRATQLREACVTEALAIISEVGVEGLSIREVARRLGVSHQAPYRHFPSSDHLLAEVVRRTYAMFSHYLEARHGSDADEMRGLGVAYFQFATDHPLHYRLMFGIPLPDPALHPEMMREARYAFSILLNAIAIRRGETLTGDASPEYQLDALFVWAALHGLSTILRTAAIDQLGLQQEILSGALAHMLTGIGKALSMPESAPTGDSLPRSPESKR